MRRAGALAAAILVLLPAAASAHGLTARPDLPIPAWLFAWAAAVVLIVSFVALAALWRTPQLQEERFRNLPGGRVLGSVIAEAVLGVIGVAVFAVVIVAGLFGTSVAARSITPQIVFLQFWVWLVPVSVVFGNVFAALNPWRTIGRLVLPATGRPYPARLGRWPAVTGLFAFALFELVFHNLASPRNLAVATLIYTFVTFVCMYLYGVETWCDQGEAFAIYFAFFAAMSPFTRRGRTVGVRLPLSGLPQIKELAGTAAVVVLMIGSITYDGLAENPWWLKVGAHIRDGLSSAGASLVTQSELTALVGLLLSIAAIGGLLLLGSLGARGGLAGDTAPAVARRFAHTLIPIAFAYVGAHYLTFAIFTGQAIWPLMSDPLGRGADYFGTASYQIDFTLMGARTVWYTQVAIVVIGHVAALALAHDRALVLYPDKKAAVRSQFAMLGVMVAFTSLALWLLSEANA
jgi:hypothetical protein